MTPEVSIIISNYNHNQWLQRNVDSWSKQIFRDFEIIIIDEHSDEPINIKHDERTIIYYSDLPYRRYLGDTWNFGITKAKGKYLIFFILTDMW